MTRCSWVLWLLLALVLVAPVIRFAAGGFSVGEFGSKTHVYREPFVKTPWIAGPNPPFRFQSVVVGSSVGSQPTVHVLLNPSPPFVPPEA